MRRRLITFLPVMLFSVLAFVPAAGAEQLVATDGRHLARFDSATPGTINSFVTITGMQPGEQLVGFDVRPATGALYGVGSSSRLYLIQASTGIATQVGSSGGFTLAGASFGVDFNPVLDVLRVVSDADQNMHINPATGVGTVATSVFYGPADPNFGTNPVIAGSAYTNSVAGAVMTQLYGIDTGLDILVTQANNAGMLGTVGPLGVAAGTKVGFDISGDSGFAYAALTTPTLTTLSTVSLITGVTTLVGTVGSGIVLADLAVAGEPRNSIGLDAASYTVAEGAGFLNVTVNRTGDWFTDSTVTLGTVDGTAKAGSDYTATTTSLTFTGGEMAKTVTIPIADQGSLEGDETFQVALSTPSGGAQLTGTLLAQVSITDRVEPDTTAPTLLLAPYESMLRSRFRSKGVALNVLATEASTVTATLRIKGKSTVLGRVVKASTRAGVVRLTLKPNAAGRKALARKPKARYMVTITGVDAAGNAATPTTRRLLLR